MVIYFTLPLLFQKLVMELNLLNHTVFTGRVSNVEKLVYYYSAANICVVPSHFEPFGLVALESMACRTPVVASNVGGLKVSVVHGVTGLLCDPKNDQEFTRSIDRLLQSEKTRNEFGIAGRQRVQELFTWSAMADKLTCIYAHCSLQ